jgi:putative hydrolase of HD superfamily
MLAGKLLEFIHEPAGMQRWNDHIHPHKGFSELDKQSHKMIYAYVLAKFEESDGNRKVDWQKLIEGGLFELFHRIILTDIKPPVFHKLMSEKGDELNRWVINKLEGTGLYHLPGDIRGKIEKYFFDPEYCPLEKKILRASHYLATNWEFKIVYRLSSGFYRLEETKRDIENKMEEHIDLAGVRKLSLGRKTSDFLDLIGQLRFQQRWAQTPRIPETSVLGHMLIVAIISFLVTIHLNPCSKRVYNNFFGGLFHDLPEVLTRDIISPVKSAVEQLDSIIKEIEQKQVEEKILPLLPEHWHSEIRYFTLNEFDTKIIENGKARKVSPADINLKYNLDEYSPIDGTLLKACDKLSVFLEAYLSIKYGIDTGFLREGYCSTYKKYRDIDVPGFDFGTLFDEFRIEELLG